MSSTSAKPESVSRRSWLQAATTAMAPLASEAVAGAQAAEAKAEPPNVVLVISDQFRWDCVGAAGMNPMNLTPNLDAMARRGVMFRNAISAQPVCAPARASIFTGQYPSRHGVWRNTIGLKHDTTTLATALRHAGYSANYIGKWHLAGDGERTAGDAPDGPVGREDRGGFLDLWQASNVLEFTSHAYEGDLFDNDGKAIHFSGVYRADFMTGLAQQFLKTATKPFFLTVSYLEVHHQNDCDSYVPPKEYVERYGNPFIPHDLRPLPGSWPSQLPDYYRCVARIDDCVGAIRKTLAETGLEKNTILAFLSDHGCHFKTRNSEYKRSLHEGSIHVPLIVEGPGFNRGLEVPQLVSHVDVAPTLLEACGVAVPGTMQCRSALPLIRGEKTDWRDEAYFEMAEFMTGRGLRTPQYTYAAAVPKTPDWKMRKAAAEYTEYMLYDLYADPYQQVNMAGRVEYREVSRSLWERLAARIVEAGGEPASILPCVFPYC